MNRKHLKWLSYWHSMDYVIFNKYVTLLAAKEIESCWQIFVLKKKNFFFSNWSCLNENLILFFKKKTFELTNTLSKRVVGWQKWLCTRQNASQYFNWLYIPSLNSAETEVTHTFRTFRVDKLNTSRVLGSN